MIVGEDVDRLNIIDSEGNRVNSSDIALSET